MKIRRAIKSRTLSSAEKTMHDLHVWDGQDRQTDEEDEQPVAVIKVAIDQKVQSDQDDKGQYGE